MEAGHFGRVVFRVAAMVDVIVIAIEFRCVSFFVKFEDCRMFALGLSLIQMFERHDIISNLIQP
jgi:hypothetical protein